MRQPAGAELTTSLLYCRCGPSARKYHLNFASMVNCCPGFGGFPAEVFPNGAFGALTMALW